MREKLSKLHLTWAALRPSYPHAANSHAELQRRQCKIPRLVPGLTRLMTVTRQEETLIAAMRMKKTSMTSSDARAHRKGTLRLLELGPDGSVQPPQRTSSRPKNILHGSNKLQMPGEIRQRSSRSREVLRPESGTTFQTESLRERSSRGSFATDFSDELELPYTAMPGMIPASLRKQSRPKARETFLSEMTVIEVPDTPTTNHSRHESHVVQLDPLDRQLLREQIPSQLFMERPFLGWEARANLETTAH